MFFGGGGRGRMPTYVIEAVELRLEITASDDDLVRVFLGV